MCFIFLPTWSECLLLVDWNFPRVLLADDFLNPGHEGGDFGVNAGCVLQSTCVTPRCDPIYNPTSTRPLTHQRTSAISTATVHAAVVVGGAGTQHAIGELVRIAPLTLTLAQHGNRGLLESFWICTTWEKKRGGKKMVRKSPILLTWCLEVIRLNCSRM